MTHNNNLDDILVFDQGDLISFFSKEKYEVGYMFCTGVFGKLRLYAVNSVMALSCEKKTYFAKEIITHG